jgi:Ca2+-binding RTX toxin-like protein
LLMAILDPLDPGYTPRTSSFTSGVITGTRFDDVLVGTDREDTIYGGGGNDLIYGDSKAAGYQSHDTLFGNSGNDTLIGGIGNDLLRGGPGRDTFKYNSSSETSYAAHHPGDTIVDFTSADFIDLSAVDANSRVAGNQAFRFVGQVSTPNHIGLGQAGVYLGDRGGLELLAKPGDKNMRITLQGTFSINSSQIIL